jgi:hypothetical protein
MIRPIKRYHPERHYMRGPGPKWLEKHGGGVGPVDAVMDDRRPDKPLPTNFLFQLCATPARLGGTRNNMIRIAIVSVIASFALVGVWTADLVSHHPAMELNPLASPSTSIPDDRLRDFGTGPVKAVEWSGQDVGRGPDPNKKASGA